MSQLRVEKVQELMKQEISKIILRELKDPRIGFVTVTSVECTGDLREAKVYVSLMGSEQQVKVRSASSAARSASVSACASRLSFPSSWTSPSTTARTSKSCC